MIDGLLTWTADQLSHLPPPNIERGVAVLRVGLGLATAYTAWGAARSLLNLGKAAKLHGATSISAALDAFFLRTRRNGELTPFAPTVLAALFFGALTMFGVEAPWYVWLPFFALWQLWELAFELTPPTVLLLTSSRWQAVRLFGLLDRGIHPYRVAVLLEPAAVERDRHAEFHWSNFRLGNLRLRNMKDWERVVIRLARRTPFIVLDSRNPSQAVVTETARILENPSLLKKTLFVIDEGGVVESVARLSPARPTEPLNTTIFDTLVANLRRIGLPKTSSPDDNPVLRQMMFDEHSKKLGFQMRAIQWLVPPLVLALKDVDRHPGVRRRDAVRGIYFDDTNPEMAADAFALLTALGENPTGGALAILATLDRDVAYLGEYVEKWMHAREPHQRRLWLRVRALHNGMLKLQRLRDLAPASFAKMNTDALRALG